MINSNNYIKFLSKKLSPEFRDLLSQLSYKYFTKDLPHTTNPTLNIIDEENYPTIKCSLLQNDGTMNYTNFKVEFLSGSYFNSNY